jgi:ribosomal protein S18 acetylase RimI-like enzyme
MLSGSVSKDIQPSPLVSPISLGSRLAAKALPRISLRDAAPEDRELLFTVYADSRAEELARVPWTAEQKADFLRQQFEAQDAWWREHYTTAEFSVIVADGEPAGRLYVDEWKNEVRIVDVAVLSTFRGRGIGTRLVRDVIARADRAGKPVSIHVEMFNTGARRLYERLGFELVKEEGVYLLMRRPVSASA